jgi:pathogenesis-related protein 1
MQTTKMVAGRALHRFFAAAVLPLAAAAASVGEHYIVDGRCVKVTQVSGSQADYEWSAGDASGSGNLPTSELVQRCSPGLAPPAAATAPLARVPAANSPLSPYSSDRRLALSASEAQALVESHNAVRAQVGVGPVAWDAKVADFAQRYVSTLVAACDLRHSSRSGYGENLAAWTGEASPTQAVAQWAEEKPLYRADGGPFRSSDMPAGHYTQVVWRSTTHIGCGRATCAKDGYTWTLLSCNYSPPGNMMGARVF